MKIKIGNEEYRVGKYNSSLNLWEVVSTTDDNKTRYVTAEQIKVLSEDD